MATRFLHYILNTLNFTKPTSQQQRQTPSTNSKDKTPKMAAVSPFPSLTKAWHTASYPAINPTLPSLSAANKTVLITGGGSGIGASIATSFAKAGAPRITLIGRTESTLARTKAQINALYPSTQVLIAPGDLSSKASITAAFELAQSTFGAIDIFVSNAGYLSSAALVAELDAEDWWTGMKTNALGSLYSIQAFAPRAAKDAVVLNISSGIAHFPPIPGFSGYATSKLAGTKVFDYFQAENPQLRVVSVQPGVVVTTLNQKSGIPGQDDSE